MRQPDIWTPDSIKKWDVQAEVSPSIWLAARPVGHNAFSWKWRFKLAWKVFTGKYDVLHWEG